MDRSPLRPTWTRLALTRVLDVLVLLASRQPVARSGRGLAGSVLPALDTYAARALATRSPGFPLIGLRGFAPDDSNDGQRRCYDRLVEAIDASRVGAIARARVPARALVHRWRRRRAAAGAPSEDAS